MKDFLPKNFSWRFPKSKKEEQEYGKGKKDILVCEKCGAFYWYKSWHHHLSDYPELKESKNINFTLCPACKMIENGKYEGEILVENIDTDKETEVENLIQNFSETAFEKDPMDRIISIEKIAKGMLRVLTTENQMAKQLAKKLKRTFKGRVNFTFSKKESTLRAKVVL
jgi:hypothetical protein